MDIMTWHGISWQVLTLNDKLRHERHHSSWDDMAKKGIKSHESTQYAMTWQDIIWHTWHDIWQDMTWICTAYAQVGWAGLLRDNLSVCCLLRHGQDPLPSCPFHLFQSSRVLVRQFIAFSMLKKWKNVSVFTKICLMKVFNVLWQRRQKVERKSHQKLSELSKIYVIYKFLKRRKVRT